MRIRLLVLVLLAVSTPASGQLQQFQTTLYLQEPVINITAVNSVIFRWSTFELGGTVTETELQDLTMTLYVDGALRYVDEIVVDGVVQLFDGQVREPEIGYFWRFNLATVTLEQMVNAGGDLAMGSTGERYVVNDSVSIPTDNIVDVRQYLDGVIQEGQSDFLDFQVTELLIFGDGFESGSVSQWSSATP